jgi:hypothetical protein
MAVNDPIPTRWGKNLDIKMWAKNWRQDDGGAHRRMGNKGAVISALANKVNYLLAMNPRTMFTKSQSDPDATGLDPLYRWVYYDGVPNGTVYIVHIIAQKIETAGDAYAQQWSGADHYAATHITPIYAFNITTAGSFEDVFYAMYFVIRGAASDAEVEDGISTFNDFTILSINTQEIIPANELYNDSDYTYIKNTRNLKGTKVLEGLPEDTREKLHTVRTEQLPIILNWAAQMGDPPTTPSAPGNSYCITVDDTNYPTYVNIFDQNESSRGAQTTGACVDVQYAGRGLETQTDGRKVKVICRVLAKIASGATGTVKFEGPNHHSVQYYVEITVNSTTLQWWGDSDDYIYLDPTVSATDATTARNKIDVFGKVTSGLSPRLYIYGVRCWIVYE